MNGNPAGSDPESATADDGATSLQAEGPLLQQAVALQSSGRFGEAETLYRRVAADYPDHIAILVNLAFVLAQQGQHGEAAAIYRRILTIDPDRPGITVSLALSLHNAGRWVEAEPAYAAALALEPDSAGLHVNHGIALHQLGRIEAAAAAFRHAVDLAPEFTVALVNLGTTLQALGRAAEAEAAYRQAVALDPSSSRIHSDLGTALLAQRRFEDAIPVLRRAVDLDPCNGPAHVNLGTAFLNLNRLDDAIAAFGAGVAGDPDYAEAHFGLGQALLTAGDYRRGWAEYEWRWRIKENRAHAYHSLPHPLWQGERLDGRIILLHNEQGIGDNIQCVRFIPHLLDAGAEVFLLAPASLHRLFGCIDGVTLLPLGQSCPPFHVRASLMSLPGLLGTTIETIPARVPYLTVGDDDRRRWRDALGPGGLRIGLVWAGNPLHANDRNRSLPLASLEPLFGLADTRWFSLQKAVTAADRDLMADLGPAIAPLPLDDFYDTAAAVSALDLVISVDTSVCHLAGALGRPVWVMLPFGPDWRWLLDREDTPWYPTMRLFRQPEPGAWEPVVARVRAEIERLARARRDGDGG